MAELSFLKQMEMWAKETDKRVDDLVESTRVQICKGVIQRTPIKEGGLISSWIPSIGTMSPDVVVVDEQGGELSDAEKTALRAEVLKKSTETAGKSLDNVFYLTNNKPYCRKIEYGGSRIKAPKGMVRVTIAEYKAGIKKLLGV